MPQAADEQPCQRTGSGLGRLNVTFEVAASAKSGSWFGWPRCWPRCRPSSVTIRGSGPPGYGGDAGWRPPAAGAGKPVRAAAVALKAVRWDLRWVKCAVLAGVGESRIGSTRGSRRVEHHPVRDSGTAVGGVIGGRCRRRATSVVNCRCASGSPAARCRHIGEAIRPARLTASG
jgi:hypothetical protein